MTRSSDIPVALSVAGSDSGGGAGIQADLNTFAALGVFGTTAITAVTVQTTMGVTGYQELDPATVAAQVTAVASDMRVDAAKTGMLASAAIAAAVADAIAASDIPALVVDPVSVSKHGHPLLAADAVATLRDRILPLATVVTPNLPEASALTGLAIEGRDDMRRAADALLAFGTAAVLVKGGHLAEGDADDLLVTAAGVEMWLSSPRIDTPHTHGTGCVLSAAITAWLARGADVTVAVTEGKRFVSDAIAHALDIGRGIGPVDPQWRTRVTRGSGAEVAGGD